LNDRKVGPVVLTIEAGGSSTQASRFEGFDPGQIVPLAQHRADQWLLAAPGLVEGDRVRGAHHLGWMDVIASSELGMVSPPALSMNDAEAAALGEWHLHGNPDGTLLYIGLGTGVGAVAINQGVVIPIEFSHITSFGPNVCGGCGRRGCLDALIGGHALPTPLGEKDVDTSIDVLSAAIEQKTLSIARIVVGGGIARSYPAILPGLAERVTPTVYPSASLSVYKSAAPYGLLHTWHQLPT